MLRFRIRWLVTVGATAVLVVVAVPATASAGTVGLSGGQLSFVADDGEQNTITVTGGGGQITVRDVGHNVLFLPFTDAPAQCTHPTSDSATCPASSIDVQASDLADTVDASAAAISGNGDLGAVFLNGGSGEDRLVGSPFTDTLGGDSGNDVLEGGAGRDFLTGGDGNDTDLGGDGNDALEVVAFGTFGDDTIDGGAGDDTFEQSQRDVGGLGDGADAFTGGPGRDTANYAASTGSLNVSLDGIPNDGYVAEGDNMRDDVEDLVGGPAADMLAGSDAPNLIDGGNGDDRVLGAGGDDDLRGGADAGSDTLDGGAGRDQANGGQGDDLLDGSGGDDALDGSGGTDTVSGGDGVDSLAGGPGVDNMSGGPDADSIRGAAADGVGGDGADVIHGDGGVDRISGEGGDDLLDGGAGGDVVAGGEGKDTADYRDETAPVDIKIDDQANDGIEGEGDNVTSDVEDVNGGNFQSSLVGTPGPNALTGGRGEDYMDGLAGTDLLAGGAEADALRSRDGTRETVVCGTGRDFVIADTLDKVRRSCERVDRGHTKPANGKVVLVKPGGTDLLRLPGVHRFVPLRDRVGLPVGSTVDPVATEVSIVSARPSGARQSGTFGGDPFLIKQRRGSSLTELTLSGRGSLKKCPARGGRVTSAARRVRRRLFGSAHGRFRTRGRYSSATVRGTRWSIEDRCDGTLTRVSSGSVVVRDFGRHRSVRVRAGHSYLARAPG